MLALIRFLPRRWWSPKAWKNWTRYVHWRLETYGIYHPAGQFNRQAFKQLLKQFPSYYRWLRDIDKTRQKS